MKFGLVKGFENIEFGDAQLLRIKKVVTDDKYDKVKLTFEDSDGRTLVEQYILKGDGDKPSVGLMILSTVAKCATNNFKERPFDPEDLAGLYVVADVYERVSDGKSYANLRNYRVAKETFDGKPYEPDVAPVEAEEADEDDEDIW